MTPENSPLRDLLARQSDRVHLTQDLPQAVITLERRVRRRQAITGMVAGVAALAIAIPIGMSQLGKSGSDGIPATQSSGTSSGVATLTANTARKITVDLSAPAVGAPDVPYAAGGLVHDGPASFPLPVTTGIQSIYRTAKGYAMATVDASGKSTVWLLDQEARPILKVVAASGDLVVSADRSLVACVTKDRILVFDASGAGIAERQNTDPGLPSVVGMVGNVLYFTEGDGTPHGWDIATKKVTDLTARLVAIDAQHSVGVVDQSVVDAAAGSLRTCFGAVTLGSDQLKWSDCINARPMGFTPGGKYVLTQGPWDLAPSSGDVPGTSADPTFTVIDAGTGVPLLTLQSPQLLVLGIGASGDGSAVYLSLADGARNANALVRCDIATGSCQVVGTAHEMPGYAEGLSSSSARYWILIQ